jgi:hypothetical protein
MLSWRAAVEWRIGGEYMKPLILLFLLVVPVSFGQSAKGPSSSAVTFSFCGVEVTIGQTQDEVLKAVTPACTLTNIGVEKDAPAGDSRWSLEANGSSLPGALTFNAGRLAEVQKDWSQGRNDTSDAYIESVYDALLSIDGKANGFKASCRVSLSLEVAHEGNAGVVNRYVTLDCTDNHSVHRTYNLRVMQSKQNTFGQFVESVRKQ